MIFYGTRASNLKNGKISRVTCPNCEQETSMTYSVFGKYAHIYWIPFFPYSKVTITECDQCKRTFEAKELPDNIKEKLRVESDRNPAKTPIWQFSGLIIITALIGIGIYSSKQQKSDEISYLDKPEVNDLYEYKTTSGYYSTMKVSKVTSDSVYFLLNDMETNKKSGINDIDKATNYNDTDSYSKEELKQFYKEGVIYEINR